MAYVDGFVLPVPKRKVAAYLRVSRKAGKVWKEHGALEYRECIGDDLKAGMGLTFTRVARAKPNETVVFSWIVYKSRAHRDSVNRKVMKDPRLTRNARCNAVRRQTNGLRRIQDWGRSVGGRAGLASRDAEIQHRGRR